MSEPNLQPLAALLALHPEECAAVVAALAITDPCDGRSTSGIVEDVALYFPALPRLDVGEVGVICDACCAAGFAELDRWGDYAVVEGADRYAIARMGAAAWLRARCPPAPPSSSFDDREQASRDRLCDIHAMAVHYKHPTARAIRSILIGAGNGVPVNCDKYRGLLVRIGAYGVPLDVDAEVAAVWGREAAEGAQAPNGEQR